MLKNSAKHGMIVVKIHEKIPFRPSKCLEQYKIFNAQKKEKKLKMISKNTPLNYSLTHFVEKQWNIYEIESK